MKTNIKIELYKLINSEISILDFEKYIYKNESEIAKSISIDFYYELYCFNYKSRHAKQDLLKSINQFVNWRSYNEWYVNELLDNIISKNQYYPDSLLEIYNLRNDGYSFLEILAMEYGLKLIDGYEMFKGEMSKISDEDRNEMLGNDYQPIIEEAKKVKNWIKDQKIIFENRYIENTQRLSFEDRRSFIDVPKSEIEYLKFLFSSKSNEINKPSWWKELTE